MTFAQLPAGASVFLDANTLVYHFASEPRYGSDCTRLIERIEHPHRVSNTGDGKPIQRAI